jgi:hypothetical protein
MKKTVLSLAPLAVLLFTAGLVAQSKQLTTEAFSWNAELVALEENIRTATVKAPIVSDQAGTHFTPLKTGERILLQWSGFENYADSIASAVRMTDLAKAKDRFTFPVEFVAFDAARRCVTFKVQIPENEITKIKMLKPGDWVTATSPQGSASKTTPVVEMRPYVLSANIFSRS